MQEFRPSITDASVLEEAVARTVVLLEATAPLEKINQQTARLDLADAFSSYRDGYEMAKFLESRGWWFVDADTVAALETSLGFLESALQRAVRDWVIRVSLRPAHKIGDVVRFAYRNRLWEGTIFEISYGDGKYHLASEAMAAEFKWSSKSVVPWEQLDQLNRSSI